MRTATSDVRYTNDRKSGFPQTAMSASPPKAAACGANRHVCYGPEADIRHVIRYDWAQAQCNED